MWVYINFIKRFAAPHVTVRNPSLAFYSYNLKQLCRRFVGYILLH